MTISRAFVRAWRSIIDENLDRLEFVNRILNLDPSVAEGMEYVRENYGGVLPANLRLPGEAEGAPSE